MSLWEQYTSDAHRVSHIEPQIIKNCLWQRGKEVYFASLPNGMSKNDFFAESKFWIVWGNWRPMKGKFCLCLYLFQIEINEYISFVSYKIENIEYTFEKCGHICILDSIEWSSLIVSIQMINKIEWGNVGHRLVDFILCAFKHLPYIHSKLSSRLLKSMGGILFCINKYSLDSNVRNYSSFSLSLSWWIQTRFCLKVGRTCKSKLKYVHLKNIQWSSLMLQVFWDPELMQCISKYMMYSFVVILLLFEFALW